MDCISILASVSDGNVKSAKGAMKMGSNRETCIKKRVWYSPLARSSVNGLFVVLGLALDVGAGAVCIDVALRPSSGVGGAILRIEEERASSSRLEVESARVMSEPTEGGPVEDPWFGDMGPDAT